MVRVKPDAIRCCNCEYAKDYWVVDGTNNEIRPYRILYKKNIKNINKKELIKKYLKNYYYLIILMQNLIYLTIYI